jgi:SAM-dependent methyltransferase
MPDKDHAQMTGTVIRQFEEQIDVYSHRESEVNSQVIPFLKKELPGFKKDQAQLTLCEFGGAGGDLLDSVDKISTRELILTNAELVKEYAKHQASKKINFLERSILDSGFPDNSFDIVIVRSVLHHLVSRSLSQTRDNQRHAIRELVRVTKPGGLILIDEQINYSPIACIIFFYGSLLATKLKINIPAYQITENTVVGYLTRKRLQMFCKQVVSADNWKQDAYRRWPVGLRWKVTGLMNNTGEAFIAMQKP